MCACAWYVSSHNTRRCTEAWMSTRNLRLESTTIQQPYDDALPTINNNTIIRRLVCTYRTATVVGTYTDLEALRVYPCTRYILAVVRNLLTQHSSSVEF